MVSNDMNVVFDEIQRRTKWITEMVYQNWNTKRDLDYVLRSSSQKIMIIHDEVFFRVH